MPVLCAFPHRMCGTVQRQTRIGHSVLLAHMREDDSNAKRPSTQQPGSEEAQATEEARRAAGFVYPAAASKSALTRLPGVTWILRPGGFVLPRFALRVDGHRGTGRSGRLNAMPLATDVVGDVPVLGTCLVGHAFAALDILRLRRLIAVATDVRA